MQLTFGARSCAVINYQFFPRSNGINEQIKRIVDCFTLHESAISSATHTKNSNEVLAILKDNLEKCSMKVEAGKARNDKISVPVLFGLNGKIDKYFDADAVSYDGKIVLEIEAGRAVSNNQFLKDIFQACMMHGVEYLIIAVRNDYRGNDDFSKIQTFLETMYVSNKFNLPLKGILLIGY